jgi:hypothetical protein
MCAAISKPFYFINSEFVEKSVLAEGFESVEIDVLQHFLVKD